MRKELLQRAVSECVFSGPKSPVGGKERLQMIIEWTEAETQARKSDVVQHVGVHAAAVAQSLDKYLVTVEEAWRVLVQELETTLPTADMEHLRDEIRKWADPKCGVGFVLDTLREQR